jgi:hypothetical protein
MISFKKNIGDRGRLQVQVGEVKKLKLGLILIF